MPDASARLLSRYGPWAVVTGASEGIGREFAVQLAAAGLNLVIVARRRDALDALALQLEREHGIEVRALPADLATSQGVTSVLLATETTDVGLLVAAAGFGSSGSFLSLPVEAEVEMIDVNCRAVTELAHRFGQRFARRGRGGIVLMSSILAFQGVPRACTYAATKAYVQSLAEGLHFELKPHGVDVIASAPGPVRSGFEARAGMKMDFALTPDVVARTTLAAIGRGTTVRPGWLSALLGGSLAVLPRWGRVRIMAVVMRGMAKAG